MQLVSKGSASPEGRVDLVHSLNKEQNIIQKDQVIKRRQSSQDEVVHRWLKKASSSESEPIEARL